MTFGFSATNGNRQLLISDEVRTLHFYEKARHYGTVADSFCGGFRVYSFITTTPDIPIPFFTAPNVGDTYGITRIYGGPGGWTIEIIHSINYFLNGIGIGGMPEVYIFSDLNNRPVPYINANGTVVQDNMGLVVYGPNGPGTIAHFDSRYLPLVITGGWSATPPSSPFDNSISPGGGSAMFDEQVMSANALYASNRDSPSLSNSFAAKNYNVVPGSNVVGSKPIFSYSSMGQCERDAGFDDHSDWYVSGLFGSRYGGTIWASSLYWCFYRSAIGRAYGSVFCSWAPAKRGYAYSIRRDEAGANGIFGLVGMAAGAAFGGSGGAFLGAAYGSTIQVDPNTTVTSNGLWPYSNKTLNTGASAVLMSDGALYD